jgi:hypothetical protein
MGEVVQGQKGAVEARGTGVCQGNAFNLDRLFPADLRTAWRVTLSGRSRHHALIPTRVGLDPSKRPGALPLDLAGGVTRERASHDASRPPLI